MNLTFNPMVKKLVFTGSLISYHLDFFDLNVRFIILIQLSL